MYVPSFDGQPLWVHTVGVKHPQITIIILHGLGGDSQCLIPLAQELTNLLPTAACVVYDLRAHGNSSPCFSDQSTSFLHHHALDLQTISQHYAQQQLIFVGHSLGGMIVQEYLALKLQPQPQKTILVASTLTVWGSRLLSRLSFNLLKTTPRFGRSSCQRDIYTHLKFANSHDFNLWRIHQDIKTQGWLSWILSYGSLCGWKNPNIKTIDQPQTLLLFGESDHLVTPKAQRSIQQRLSMAAVDFLPTNHLSVFQNPRLTAKKIAQFIASDKTVEFSHRRGIRPSLVISKSHQPRKAQS